MLNSQPLDVSLSFSYITNSQFSFFTIVMYVFVGRENINCCWYFAWLRVHDGGGGRGEGEGWGVKCRGGWCVILFGFGCEIMGFGVNWIEPLWIEKNVGFLFFKINELNTVGLLNQGKRVRVLKDHRFLNSLIIICFCEVFDFLVHMFFFPCFLFNYFSS